MKYAKLCLLIFLVFAVAQEAQGIAVMPTGWRSCSCQMLKEEVCGVDYVTYRNRCFLDCFKVEKLWDGSCI